VNFQELPESNLLNDFPRQILFQQQSLEFLHSYREYLGYLQLKEELSFSSLPIKAFLWSVDCI